MNTIEFANPYIFWLVGILSVLVLIFFWWQRKQQKVYAVKIPFLEDLQLAQKKSSKLSFKKFIYFLPWGFFILSVFFLTIALARPQSISEEKKITKN